MHTLNRI